MSISSKDIQINEEIRDKEVRVILDDGTQLGIMSAKEALKVATEKNLDLVKIAPQAKPPVCKVMDYGKYRFEQAKREKEAKKNQHVVDIKEIRLSLKIDTHDFETKANQAKKFLKSGNKIKITCEGDKTISYMTYRWDEDDENTIQINDTTIDEENKAKVSIRFRGREMAHPEQGLTTMEDFAVACEEFGVVEKKAKLEGRQMLMFLSPKPNK